MLVQFTRHSVCAYSALNGNNQFPYGGQLSKLKKQTIDCLISLTAFNPLTTEHI